LSCSIPLVSGWILFDLRLYHDWQPEVSAGHKINQEDDPTVEAAASNLGGKRFVSGWILFGLRLYHDWQPEVSVGQKINKEDAPTVEAAASNLEGEIFLKLNSKKITKFHFHGCKDTRFFLLRFLLSE
jgi:hypothetical protein